MTHLSLTSGEIMDIVTALSKISDETENPHLADYYDSIAIKFQPILDKLYELPGEKREATLVIAL